MTAITEWGIEDRAPTFSFYMTAHLCTQRPDMALSAASLADTIAIAGPKGPNAAVRLRKLGFESPLLFDGTGYTGREALAPDVWVRKQRDVGAVCPLLPGVFLPWNKDDHSEFTGTVREQSYIASDLGATMLLAIDARCIAKQTDLLVDTLRSTDQAVALVLAHRADPLSVPGAVAGLRRIASQISQLSVLRSDHGAIGALAFGADHASIGLTTSTRHYATAAMGARRRPGSSARVFVRSLLDWFLASEIAGWTAAGSDLVCGLQCCEGQSLDRFLDPEQDVNWHNMNALADFARYVLNAHAADRRTEFRNECRTASLQYGIAGFKGPENPKPQLTGWVFS